jgi:putative cell wall-binding protein
VRTAGPSRVETAVAAAQLGWDDAEVAVLATAGAFPDALVGGALAAGRGGPLLLTARGHLPPAVAAELERLDVAEVLVLGGAAAVGDAVLAAVRGLPQRPTVRRIAGADRWATAAHAAAAGADVGGTVLLASGADFPDALAGSALPVAGGRPAVVLTAPDVLPAASAEALARLAPTRLVAAGGPAALSDAVLRAAADAAGSQPEITRLAGPTRYATSAAVLTAGLDAVDAGPRPLVVATGGAFPDALAATALAARLDGLVALAPRFRLADAVEQVIRDAGGRFDRVVVLGGEGAVDRDVLAELEAAVGGTPRPPAALHSVGTDRGYRGTARPLPAAVAEEMHGTSWHEGCPVPLTDLVLLALTHHTFDDSRADGELVVHRDVAADVLGAFAAMHDAGFPIERMERIDAYGGDDDASMAANNTSAFNCRRTTGGSRWSEHALGTAIDVNPVQNPYVRGDTVLPEAGRAYLDRSRVRPGMAVRPGPMVDAFDAIGWGWGGDWSSSRDYQHVSLSGR